MTPIQAGAFRVLAGAVLSTAALGCAAERPGNESSAVVFENVTVVPMDQERVLERRSVLVEAGRISAIGPAESLAAPQGARRIDGTGKFLMPGLADMHVHLYDTDGFLSYLAYGVTTVANLDGNPRVLEWRDAVNSGRLIGPTVYTTGPSLDGVPAGNELFVSLANPADASAEVTRQHRAGYDMLKVYSGLGADEYDAVIDQARNEHMPVVGHVPLDVGADRILRGPQANIAHMEEVYNGYSSGVGAILEGKPSDTAFIPRIAAAVKRSGTTVTPNLFAFSDYLRSIADLPAVLADSEMRYASPAQYSEKLPSHNRSVRDNPEAFARALRSLHAFFALLTKAMSDSGVPLLVGTDTEIFGYPGSSTHAEIGELVAAGLTPFQALAASTRNVGAFVKRSVRSEEEFGTVAAGQRADLVLLERNPLDDVRNVLHPLGVMARGRWFSREDLQRLRDSVARKNAPLRARVGHLDSLLVAGKAADGIRELADVRREAPASLPVAEIVLLEARFGALRGDRTSLQQLARITAETYPKSHAAHWELGRALLDAGDTAAAEAELRRARELTPYDNAAADLQMKIDAARTRPQFSPAGTYSFSTIVRSNGKLIPETGTFTLSGQAGTYTGTFKSASDAAERPINQVIAGGNQMWITSGSVNLIVTVRGDSFTGRYRDGYANDHAVSGKRLSAPATG